MKLFKKAREALGRIAGKTEDAVEAVAEKFVESAAAAQEALKPEPRYRVEQRDFRARAKAVTVFWDTARLGTCRSERYVE